MKFPEKKEFTLQLADQKIIVEIGKFAHQADGACTVKIGDTIVMATAVFSKQEPREGVDYLPLSVNFQERYFASGMIKSSRFQKRAGRPADDKILISRLIDRGLRPLFPKNIHNDIQVMIYPLSFDKENEFDIASALAASLAVTISPIPFKGPLSTVRVGMIDEKLVLNPLAKEREDSALDLIVSSTENNVVMIEAGANQISEEKMLQAIEFGKEEGKKICNFFKQIENEVGKEKIDFPEIIIDQDLENFVKEHYIEKIRDCIFTIEGKLDRFAKKRALMKEAQDQAEEKFSAEYENLYQVSGIFDRVFKEIIRESVLKNEKRIAERKLDQIRPLSSEVSFLPRVHGSALFQRGETQALTAVTLASPGFQMISEGIEGEKKHRFFHHYSFPPFSVGECSNRLFTGNREIGHGALAERALKAVLPPKEDFVYTIHAHTEILSSNGSSSMAATCGTTLALMDAGVPIIAPVAGIAMGLMSDSEGNFKILSDIQDEEDFGGDMDFKVAGTKDGITAIQMDIKVEGLTKDIFEKALKQAKVGRMKILESMLAAIEKPRDEISLYAPRLLKLQINPKKIKDVIGKGGETINKIIEETGCEIEIEQNGNVIISSVDSNMAEKAEQWIKDLTTDPQVGQIYEVKITRIEDYGAFAELASGQQGLIHISLIAKSRVNNVNEFLKIGQKVKVKLIEIDNQGRIRLSMKDANEN